MKLRYYLRGLGIGMIVTALLMGVALKGNKPLSDAEVRVRAMELGMVDGESRTLADVQSSQGEGEPSPDGPGSTGVPQATASPAVTPAAEPAATAAPTAEPTATSIPTAEPENTTSPLKPLPMVTLKPSQDASTDQADEQSASVTFEVHLGQSSYSVSKALAEAGLVEDASEFDQYLVDNGYSKRISTGTYEIPLESSQEEIAKIITRSR